MSKHASTLLGLCLSTLLLLAGASRAEPAPKPDPQAAFEAAQAVSKLGPVDLPLHEQAVLHLPKGYVFVPRPEADQLMRAWGNSVDERFLGLIFPDSEAEWTAVAEYEPAGYIKDDDARSWDVDGMLESIKRGTEAANEERAAAGFRPLEVLGWVQKPSYDEARHQLVWSMAARQKGAEDAAQSVNYNTYALGREGYISLNLIADLSKIEGYKADASTLLQNLEFNQGKRYADFKPETDHVAEYGLAALVGGVAAKKLGMFALLAAFAAKFAKAIGLAVVGIGAVVRQWLKRRHGGMDA